MSSNNDALPLSVQSLGRVQFFVTPWITAHQASLSITNSQSSPRLTSIKSVMPSSHLTSVVPSPPTPNPSKHQGLFQWVSSYEVAKVLEFQLKHHSFQRNPRVDLLFVFLLFLYTTLYLHFVAWNELLYNFIFLLAQFLLWVVALEFAMYIYTKLSPLSNNTILLHG